MGFEHFILYLLKSHNGRIVVSMMSIITCSFFAVIAWPSVPDAIHLSQAHRVCVADVVDYRYSTGMNYFDGTYDLQYEFRITPRGQWFGRTEKGPLGRKELWASLPKQQWLEATRSRKVSVAYWAEDPSVNLLAYELPSNLRWVAGGSIVLAILIISSTAWFLRLVAKSIAGHDLLGGTNKTQRFELRTTLRI